MLETLLNDRYQVIRELGAGGFGTTYLAKDTETNDSWCAIKKLNPVNADLETAQNLFRREADTLLRLQEIPQVPKFIDYFEEDDCYFIVEEYIEGKSLENLETEQWSINNITIFLWDILSILQLLHSRNIIHRDIKPSNLIQRNKDYKFTIIDFGAVKAIDPQESKKGTCIFHPGYAPIEQMQGLPRLNSDIYALGMTAMQLLTNIPPRELIRDKKGHAMLPEATTIPQWLLDILNKMIRTDAQERYQSVEEVLKDLGQRNKQSNFAPTLLENNSNLNGIEPSNEDPEITLSASVSSRKIKPKLLYLPLLLLALILGSEMINPRIIPWYYLRQGNSLLDRNQPQESLKQFQKVLKLQRDSAAAWKARGDALFILRRYSGALGAYNKAISLEPSNFKALNNKGKILAQQGDLAQAIEAHQQAIKVEPNNADSWSSLGLAQMNLQQPQEALQSFDRAQEIAPDNPAIWIHKGLVLKALQRPEPANMFYQEALAAYDEVTSKDQKNPTFWSDRGFVLLQLGRPQEAFASYDRALGIDPNFFEALIGKANGYGSVEEYEKALSLYDQAIAIRPQDDQVRSSRGNLLLQALSKPEAALRSFQKASSLNANSYQAWLGQGLALVALKKYDQAREALITATKINDQDPYAWFNLGIAFEAVGELPAAGDSYQQAVRLGFSSAQEDVERIQDKLNI